MAGLRGVHSTGDPDLAARGARARTGLIVSFRASFMGYDIEGPDFVAPDQAWAVQRAHDFDLLVAHEGVYDAYIDAMTDQNQNPDFRGVAVYINMMHHKKPPGVAGGVDPSWYVRYLTGPDVGEPVVVHDLWVMNPREQGWIDHQIDLLHDRLASSGYPTAYIDGGGLGPWVPNMRDPATDAEWTKADWLKDMKPIWSRVRDDPEIGVPAWANNLGSPQDFYDDNAQLMLRSTPEWFRQLFSENYLRGATEPITAYPTAAEYDAYKSMVADCHGRLTAMTKLWATGTPTQAEKDRWHAYALATYMATGRPGTAFYCTYVRAGESASPNPTAFHPWWGVAKSLGEATDQEYGDHIRKRQFTNGMVAVNITNDQRGFTPNPAVPHVSHDGMSHAAGAPITMPPKTGLLLLHV